MVSIDPLAILIVSGFQRFEREVVGGPQIAPTRLVEGLHGNGIERYGLSSGHMEAVVDVADHFFTRQQRYSTPWRASPATSRPYRYRLLCSRKIVLDTGR